jgi:hypothetical protein
MMDEERAAAALAEARVRALGRAMGPGPGEHDLARALRATYGGSPAEVMEQVWRLDVYRCRRVLMALLDQLSDEAFAREQQT